jgi:hypothetical protein
MNKSLPLAALLAAVALVAYSPKDVAAASSADIFTPATPAQQPASQPPVPDGPLRPIPAPK